MKPDDPEVSFSTQWIRQALATVADKGAGHITEVWSYLLMLFNHLFIPLDRVTVSGIFGEIGS